MFHRPKQDTTDTSGKDQETDSQSGSDTKKDATAAGQQGSASPASKPSYPVTNKTGSDKQKTSQNAGQQSSQDNSSEEKTMNKENNETQNKGRSLDAPGQKSGYQPPAATGQNAGGSYGVGAYPGANAPAADTAGQGRRLIIGPGITMSGEIEACEYLVVEGTVEAALKGAKVLEIADSGTFYGTVEIEEATIAGRFEGDITVSGRLTVTASGSITGTISYSELAVEAGATLDGKISPLAGQAKSESTSSGKTEETSSGKESAAARNDNKGKGKTKDSEDSDESELPFTGTATAAAE